MPAPPHNCQRLSFISVFAITAAAMTATAAEADRSGEKPAAAASTKDSADRQAALEAALSKMLSGATLEGSFTLAGPGGDSGKLDREKYTLGEVRKVAGEVWQFPARIEYGGKDITLPILLPVRWAGDTPVVVVDQVDLPGFGSVSARVLFFEGHYAGYWKHGDHSGNLFGLIHSAEAKSAAPPKSSPEKAQPSGSNPPAKK